jgi:sugar phosphate isomerase/epimerase
MKSAVTVSLVPDAKGGPFVLWDNLAAAADTAAELGFDAIELFPPDADALDPAELFAITEDRALEVAAVGTGAGKLKHGLTLCHPEESERKTAKDFIRRIIEVGAELNAPAIIGSMQGRTGDGVDHDTAINRLSEALQELGEEAAARGQPLIYEPLNRYETDLCNTLEAGAELLRSLQTEEVELLADLFHMNIEEADPPAAIRAAADQIGHVHFADSNRRAAGFGHLHLDSIAEALQAIGYTGYASAEALPLPDPKTAAEQTITAYRRLFAPTAGT